MSLLFGKKKKVAKKTTKGKKLKWDQKSLDSGMTEKDRVKAKKQYKKSFPSKVKLIVRPTFTIEIVDVKTGQSVSCITSGFSGVKHLREQFKETGQKVVKVVKRPAQKGDTFLAIKKLKRG